MENFRVFDFDDCVLGSLKKQNFNTPTKIQLMGIPPALNGNDLLGIAKTGSGKTATFVLPIINKLIKLSERPEPFTMISLILAPTRELVSQIHSVFHQFGADKSLRYYTITGGVNEKWQIQNLSKGAHCVIATPGRLIDLMNQGAISLEFVSTFVIDEADRMLDMGFKEQIDEIIEMLPIKRQSLLFSATFPSEVKDLAASYLNKPKVLEANPQKMTVEGVQHKVILCEKENKPELLNAILPKANRKKTIIFANSKKSVNRILEHVLSFQLKSEVIHGDKSQSARDRAIYLFQNGIIDVLIATDVAARGLDIDDIDLVVNYDLPFEIENYVHRIGRTARNGKSGKAISFCEKDNVQHLDKISNFIKEEIKIENSAHNLIKNCKRKIVKVTGKRLSAKGRPLKHPDLCRKKKVRKVTSRNVRK